MYRTYARMRRSVENRDAGEVLGSGPADLLQLSQPCEIAECDVFVSHSKRTEASEDRAIWVADVCEAEDGSDALVKRRIAGSRGRVERGAERRPARDVRRKRNARRATQEEERKW